MRAAPSASKRIVAQARQAARKRSAASRSASAERAVRTKGAGVAPISRQTCCQNAAPARVRRNRRLQRRSRAGVFMLVGHGPELVPRHETCFQPSRASCRGAAAADDRLVRDRERCRPVLSSHGERSARPDCPRSPGQLTRSSRSLDGSSAAACHALWAHRRVVLLVLALTAGVRTH